MQYLPVTIAAVVCLVGACSAGGMRDFVGGRKVWVNNQKQNFFTASEICRSYGLQLLEIHNSEENEQANDILKKYDFDESWIDLTDLGTDDIFVWSTNGKKAVNTFWSKDSYDGKGGEQDCVSITRAFGNPSENWFDRECLESHVFMCQERKCENVPEAELSAVFWK